MSRYSGANVHSFQVEGSADPIEVAYYDDFRHYIMLYAQLGTCYFTIGDYDSKVEIALTEGHSYEPIIMPRNQIWYRGAGSKLVVVEDKGNFEAYGITYEGIPVFVPNSTSTYLQRLV